ncbi:hypothetical protein TNCV_4419801 [Trichonephila clavipes]|nr:hypothetical protein TNCV_4419801 [Trichonephila clavipes]
MMSQTRGWPNECGELKHRGRVEEISLFSRNCCKEYRPLLTKTRGSCTIMYWHIFRLRSPTVHITFARRWIGLGRDLVPILKEAFAKFNDMSVAKREFQSWMKGRLVPKEHRGKIRNNFLLHKLQIL